MRGKRKGDDREEMERRGEDTEDKGVKGSKRNGEGKGKIENRERSMGEGR